LALQPQVLFLDDPLAELNTSQIRWWIALVGGGGDREAPPAWPRTWVVATDDLRPWLAVGRQFALLQDGGWRSLGGREELGEAREPLVRELLAESHATG
jgi:ABC-type transporter Mla maintaining outer membrane lipid asymmetry ATPase subunit MlaF